jgi:hypothetical protein
MYLLLVVGQQLPRPVLLLLRVFRQLHRLPVHLSRLAVPANQPQPVSLAPVRQLPKVQAHQYLVPLQVLVLLHPYQLPLPALVLQQANLLHLVRLRHLTLRPAKAHRLVFRPHQLAKVLRQVIQPVQVLLLPLALLQLQVAPLFRLLLQRVPQ